MKVTTLIQRQLPAEHKSGFLSRKKKEVPDFKSLAPLFLNPQEEL
jgi:hypothetical protein